MILTKALGYCHRNGHQIAFPDVHIAAGRVAILQGRSGSGKSTWLALAAGLLAASQGKMCVLGQPLAMLSRAQRDAWRARHVGFLPQQLHLSNALSVERNLQLVYWAAGLPNNAQAIAHTLHTLGLSEYAHRKPCELSGGQAQRVALARAVQLTPKLILADEPTASLDDENAHIALQLLLESAQRCAATLVIATHDARVVQALPKALVYALGSSSQTQVLAKSAATDKVAAMEPICSE